MVDCCGWLGAANGCLPRLLTPRSAWLGRRVHLAGFALSFFLTKRRVSRFSITFISFGFRRSFGLVLIHSFSFNCNGLRLVLVLFTVPHSRPPPRCLFSSSEPIASRPFHTSYR